MVDKIEKLSELMDGELDLESQGPIQMSASLQSQALTAGPAGPVPTHPASAQSAELMQANAVERFNEAETATDAREIPYRDEMERAFGHDFSNVQAHVGARDALDPMGARAAAMGEKVAFSETSPSKEVVAHELTHVVQARQSGVDSAVQAKSDHSQPNHQAEVEADRVADSVMQGEHAEVREAPGAAVQFSFWGAVASTLGLSDGEKADEKDAAKAEPKKGGGAQEFLASLETWTSNMSPDQVGSVYLSWLDAVLRGHPEQTAYLKQHFNISSLAGQYRVNAFQVARQLFTNMGRNPFCMMYVRHYKRVGADVHNLLRSHMQELCALDGAFGAYVYIDLFADDRAEAEAVSEGHVATDQIVRGGAGRDPRTTGGGRTEGGYQ